MAESWVRLWAGATTDPKWTTIARKSGQRRAAVIAMFTHLLLEANDSVDRGWVGDVNLEDVASALDESDEAVQAIWAAMQGRVIEGGRLSGWDARQPIREDSGNEKTGTLSSTERSRIHRERRRQEAENQPEQAEVIDSQRDATQCNAAQRDATRCNAPEAERESDSELKTARCSAGERATPPPDPSPPPDDRSALASPAASVCRDLKSIGFDKVNPQHPQLLGLLASGVSPGEIVAVGEEVRGQNKGFAWVLAAVKGRRDDAVIAASRPVAKPRDSPNGRKRNIHDERADTIAALTGRSQPFGRNEHDITAESIRIA